VEGLGFFLQHRCHSNKPADSGSAGPRSREWHARYGVGAAYIFTSSTRRLSPRPSGVSFGATAVAAASNRLGTKPFPHRLSRSTRRGFTAAARATDAVLARRASADEVRRYIAQRRGREVARAAYTTFRAIIQCGGDVRERCRVVRRLMPAQTHQGSFPLGADVRRSDASGARRSSSQARAGVKASRPIRMAPARCLRAIVGDKSALHADGARVGPVRQLPNAMESA
jgi:hypothetical protein